MPESEMYVRTVTDTNEETILQNNVYYLSMQIAITLLYHLLQR